jgi:hypothetical protein
MHNTGGKSSKYKCIRNNQVLVVLKTNTNRLVEFSPYGDSAGKEILITYYRDVDDKKLYLVLNGKQVINAIKTILEK